MEIKVFKQNEAIQNNIEDINRIINVMKDLKIELSPREVEYFWEKYSEKLDCDWANLPNNDVKLAKIIHNEIVNLFERMWILW